MHNLSKIFVFSLALCNTLLSLKQDVHYARAMDIKYGSRFNVDFNDLSDVDISYSKGNMVTSISNDLEFYASSFSFNGVDKELQFGRNSHALIKNIGDGDELYMCFDLAGYVDVLSFELGMVNTNGKGNIILKVENSIDKGSTWLSVENSEKKVTMNSTYSLNLNTNYKSVRYKLVMANVNGVAGKNVALKSLSLEGKKIYPQSVSEPIKMIDECDCETYKTKFIELLQKYSDLSAYDKDVFKSVLTNDNVTSYYE